MHGLAPQIEETVFEAHLLGIIGFGVDREGQRLGLRDERELGDLQFDLAGRELGVDRVGRALDHLAGQRHDDFEAQGVGRLEERALDIDHALRHAVMVAQIDEQELAVIALPMHPAREPRRLPRIGQAQRAARMCPVGMHGPSIA